MTAAKRPMSVREARLVIGGMWLAYSAPAVVLTGFVVFGLMRGKWILAAAFLAMDTLFVLRAK